MFLLKIIDSNQYVIIIRDDLKPDNQAKLRFLLLCRGVFAMLLAYI